MGAVASVGSPETHEPVDADATGPIPPGAELPPIQDLFLCVEWTDVCDIRCQWCDQFTRRTPHGHAKGFIDPEVFRRLMEDVSSLPVPLSGIAPHWIGESMLHPKYADMIRTAFDANADNGSFGFFSTNSNGITLDERNRAAILEAAARTDQRHGTFRLLFVSVDAAHPETYQKLKGKDALAKIERNVETMLRTMVEQGLEFPRVIVKFIVTEDTAPEAGAFLEKWREIFRRAGVETWQENYDHLPPWEHHAIFFDKILGVGDPADAERLHRDVVVSLGLRDGPTPPAEPDPGPAPAGGAAPIAPRGDGERLIHSDEQLDEAAPRRPCPALWKSPMIDWRGDLVPCCNDSQGDLRLGNLNHRSFRELWFGPAIHDLRVKHVLGDFSMVPCDTCPNQRHPCMSDEEIESYLRACGEEELIPRYRERMGTASDDG